MTKRSIFVLSDSTGETGERVVRAAMLQFPKQEVRVRLVTRIRDRVAVSEAIRKAHDQSAFVVFTLVSPELREHCHAEARQHGVEALDLIGALIHRIAGLLETEPINLPGPSPLSEEYFRRVEAIEFAVKSDDGKEPRNLRRAELVLVGVSRTSKTPLSTYLAGRGLKVANVPLVLGVEPPPELFEVPGERVVGLTIELDQLLKIRNERLKHLGMSADASYGLNEHVQAELDYARSIFDAHPEWLVVNVTHRAIEETATIILEAMKDREERRTSSLFGAPPSSSLL